MNKQLSPNPSWHEGSNYPSPVRNILAFDYYDGPTSGGLQCADEAVYRFDLLAWEQETQDIRVFALSPLPRPGWEQLIVLCSACETPRWPIWVVGWHDGLHQPIEEILRQASPVQWIAATEDWQGIMLRVKAIRPEKLNQVADWGTFLGLDQELPNRGPY